MLGLKKLTSRQVTDTVSGGLSSAGRSAKSGATTVYHSVMSHPKTTAAVVLGTGAAAVIWWMLRNPERVNALRQQIASRTEARRQARLARRSGA